MASALVAGDAVELMRVLMLTSVWPTEEHPELAPFVVRQVRFLRQQGIDVTVFPVAGHKDPRRYWRAWKQVRGVLARASYDLIHAQWAQAALAGMPSRLPLVVTFRGSDVEGTVNSRQRYTVTGWGLRQVARFVGRAADQAIVVASGLARRLPQRAYHVIPSGLDLDLFKPGSRTEARARLGLSQDGRYILFAASPHNPVKRYGLAQAAIEQVKPRYNAELLVAAGADPQTMPLYMNACDALLVTSHHEGSPNVVKEALACNLPVISTDVGDVAERIGGVDGCYICPIAGAREIAAQVERVLDQGRRVAGRQAVSELDETQMTRRVIAVYEMALQRAPDRERTKDSYENLIDHSLP